MLSPQIALFSLCVALRNRVIRCFESGRVYPRAELQFEWGATTELQRQGGILTPREVPLIVVVTGEEGRASGFADYWDGEGVFPLLRCRPGRRYGLRQPATSAISLPNRLRAVDIVGSLPDLSVRRSRRPPGERAETCATG